MLAYFYCFVVIRYDIESTLHYVIDCGVYLGYYLRHARNMWLGGLGGFLAFLYDDIAVGTFSGTTNLGYYRKAYDLALLPLAFISGAAEVMMPTYARARDDREGLTLAATTILDVVSKVVFPLGALLAIAAPEIIALYLGPQ